MEKELPFQFQFIGKAKDELISWAKRDGIGLHEVEYVVPFVLEDKSLFVWIFFETDQLVQLYLDDGTVEKTQSEYLAIIQKLGYPDEHLSKIGFTIDSHENVVENFEGNYFYRLR